MYNILHGQCTLQCVVYPIRNYKVRGVERQCTLQPTVDSLLHGQCTLQLHCSDCSGLTLHYTAGTLHFGLGGGELFTDAIVQG